jgi:hypothetical protein
MTDLLYRFQQGSRENPRTVPVTFEKVECHALGRTRTDAGQAFERIDELLQQR